jgi:hypothetical protein
LDFLEKGRHGRLIEREKPLYGMKRTVDMSVAAVAVLAKGNARHGSGSGGGGSAAAVVVAVMVVAAVVVAVGLMVVAVGLMMVAVGLMIWVAPRVEHRG